MPRLYRAGNGMWRSSEREIRGVARQYGTDWHPVDVDTSVKGLLAFLNAGHAAPVEQMPNAPAAPPNAPGAVQAPPGGDVHERGLAAVRAFLIRREKVTCREIETHLRDVHKIGAGALWIGEMLRRLGWIKRRDLTKAASHWTPAEPRVRDLATGETGEPIADLLTAARYVLASPSVQPYLLTSPYAELAAAVAATSEEAPE